jgi:ppGpp synthetase/RelA/SpoT-type nucleotidyltranferase
MPARDDDEVERLKRRIVKFTKSYSDWEKTADRFRKDVEANLSQLMKQNELVPAVLESRLKSLDSAVRKVEGLDIDGVLDLRDFVGLRLVFLLTNEVAKAVELICGKFDRVLLINKGDQLKFNEFGYRAIHIIARLPRAWLSIPNYSDCGQLQFEIQLRTLSQHNYGVASRVLQYKQPEAVPPSVQRSLLRLAAILEIVDLEIERVSQEKLAYSVNAMKNLNLAEPLNVDLIIKILESKLLEKHRVPDDRYAELFDELIQNDINTTGQLLNLIKEFGETAMALNKRAAKSSVEKDPAYVDKIGKAEQGVYYSQVGLVWNMLKLKNRA